ncbi:hypothetical protein ACH518_15355 [Methylomonas sp. HW2-6]|uniref:hypothetical protein n=1 Tax=Methylomonas sp. HW2-6 TaxID=3376687 RepID=UPI00404373DF
MNRLITWTISLTLFQGLTGCTPSTGTFGLGTPTILPAELSKKSLDEYASYMQTRMSVKTKDTDIEDLDPLKTNRVSKIEYAQAVKGSVSASPNATSPISTSGNNEEILPKANEVSIITSNDKPNGLLMDKISTLEAFAAHKQRMKDLSFLYKDNQKQLYKIGFTLWIEPERQNYWEYIWRWADLYNGFRNYTKDYHADIKFRLCKDEKCIQPLDNSQVVRLEPEHEGDIADSYYASMNQSQFGLTGTWTEIAANLDYAERLRQADVEQRKHPILRGIIETKSENDTCAKDSEIPLWSKCKRDADFHFIISPRQHVEERTFYIPIFMNPYTNTQRLESVPYHVSAYIETPIKDKLYLETTACYKEYGKPERNCSNNYILDNSDSENSMKIIVPISLPRDSSQPVVEKVKIPASDQAMNIVEKTKIVETKTIEKLKQKNGSTTETTKSSK